MRPGRAPKRRDGDGGFDFLVRPSLDAKQAEIFWSPKEDTGVVLLTQPPSILSPDSGPPAPVATQAQRVDEEGRYFLHQLTDGHRLQLMQPPDLAAGEGLAAVIPLGLEGFDRIEAVKRLLSSLHGRSMPPDTRLTGQQLKRARHMLQAVDGHANGASHREIAAAIFGEDALAREIWKTSSRRFATIDLIKDGLAMIAGGYRRLLAHRRRP